MFKYCVWYTFKDSAFNNIVLRNAKLFNTYKYLAHITIQKDIPDMKEACMVADRYKSIHPMFEAYGPAIQTHVKLLFGIQLVDFYAIEQRLKINGFETDIHISLAYKNYPFTEMEIALANQNAPKHINVKDLQISVANCYSPNPSSWFVVKTLV